MTRVWRGALRSAPPAIFLGLLLAAPAAASEDPYAAELSARARELRLPDDPAWRALGHYRPRRKSQADGAAFFLSPEGKTDPEAELLATLAAFFEEVPSGDKAQHPQCRFPARYRWLKGKLAFDLARLPERPCPRFEEWRQGIDASSATLVFASAYLNNPGSMYGHTFLRLHRRGSQAGEDLLDYTINFAGNPTTSNGFLYAIEGILGFFPGTYSTLPYYMKIQEYTNVESRDLWEYDLALSGAEIDLLVRHAWEMGSTHFDYYFFTENCSYQLLALLDAAAPALRLSEDFRGAVIPGDTVKAVLKRPGLVRAVRYRPALVTQLRARRALLSSPERLLAGRLGRGEGDAAYQGLEGLAPERRALVLDSAHDLFSFRTGGGAEKAAEAKAAERRLLVERGRVGLPSPPPGIPVLGGPDQGHGSARLALGYGAGRSGPFIEAGFRCALHDLVGPEAGYPADSELEMGDFRLRYRPRDGKVWLDGAELVDIVSLSPWDSWVRKPSWQVSGGVDQAKELGCEGADCMAADLSGGGGLAGRAELPGRPLGYLLAVSNLGLGRVFRQDWRLGAGGAAGLVIAAGSALRLQAEAVYIHYPQSEDRRSVKAVASLRLSRDFELRAHAERRIPASEAGGTLHWHF